MKNKVEVDLAKTMIQKYIPYINDTSRYLAFIGGRGSGKSFASAQIIILRMLTHKFFRGVGIRKYQNLIKDSIFKTLLDVIELWQLDHLFKVNKSTLQITCLSNNNYFINRGLDEPKGLKSLREATFIYFEEELTETEEDFNTIDLSIRTASADFIQILFSLNPSLEGNPEDHWFYKFMGYHKFKGMSFINNEEGVIDDKEITLVKTSMHSTYKDNKFLPIEYRFKLENEKNEYLYSINTLGIWMRKEIDGRFYKSFSIIENTGEYKYNIDKHLYIAIDFNLWPYSAIVVFQMEDKKLYQIDEICVNDNFESSVVVALKTFKQRYNDHYLNVYICGDSTGNKGDATKEKGFNNYNIVENELKGLKLVNIVPSKNPSVIARGEFTNDVFLNGYGGIEFKINKNCQETINDFLYLKAKEDGTIKKEMFKDKEKNVTYEKYGHCFIGDTMVKTSNGDKKIKDIVLGDLVLTRKGYKKVVKKYNNGYKQVKEYTIGDKKIICTPNHKFFTKENGYKEIDQLLTKQYTLVEYNEEKGIICNQYFIKGKNLHSQRDQNIIEELQKIEKDFIELCGKQKLVKYQKDMSYIIEMVIDLIMKYQTSNLYHHLNTENITQKIEQTSKYLDLWKDSKKHKNLLKNGILQKKEENGILNTEKKIEEYISNIVLIVVNIMKDLLQNFAPENAETDIGQKNTEKKLNYQKVYDIQVEEEHEYFANDILVHNCSDCCTYLLCEIFKGDFDKWKNPYKEFKPLIIPKNNKYHF